MTVHADENGWLRAAGEVLRAKRLQQGITLDDVARATKIGKSQLAAIEDGDLTHLPAIAYVRGFVRVYAGFLGVSTDTLSLVVSPPGQVGHLSVVADAEVDRSGRKLHRRWFTPLLLGGVVVLLVYFYQQQDRPLPLPPVKGPVAAMTDPAKLAILTPATSARRPATASIEAGMESTGQEPAPVPTEGAILKLKVNQDCWLNITIDGALSQQYDLKAGDLIEWKGKQAIELDLGNAGGVEAEFNGKALAPFGAMGKVAHVVLKAETGKDVTITNP